MVKLSVIMPVYRPEYYPILFAKSLDSIFEQTYSDWELIIVIDGENPDTLQRVKKAVGKRKRIKIFMSKNNNGPGVSRNIGTMHSSGKYIIFHDADDYSEKNRFSILVNKIESCESKIVGSSFFEELHGRMFIPGEGRKFKKLSSKIVTKHKGTIVKKLSLIESMKSPFHFPTAIIDKNFFRQMGGFEPVYGAVDVIFIIKATLFHELCLEKEIPIIDLPLYHWCRHRLSITKNKRRTVSKYKKERLTKLIKNKKKILKCKDKQKFFSHV